MISDCYGQEQDLSTPFLNKHEDHSEHAKDSSAWQPSFAKLAHKQLDDVKHDLHQEDKLSSDSDIISVGEENSNSEEAQKCLAELFRLRDEKQEWESLTDKEERDLNESEANDERELLELHKEHRRRLMEAEREYEIKREIVERRQNARRDSARELKEKKSQWENNFDSRLEGLKARLFLCFVFVGCVCVCVRGEQWNKLFFLPLSSV